MESPAYIRGGAFYFFKIFFFDFCYVVNHYGEVWTGRNSPLLESGFFIYL